MSVDEHPARHADNGVAENLSGASRTYVPALKIASLTQTLAERANDSRRLVWRTTAKKSNYRHSRLLRAPRKRPHHRAAKQCDELAPLQLTELHPLPLAREAA